MSGTFLSIIVPTLGRKKELKALFDSICIARIDCQYEVLVIDQNEDHLIDEICEEYKSQLNLMQYTVQFKGISRAKNYGIAKAKGNIICFPDDDAEMTENTIFNALNLLVKNNMDCVFGKCVDKLTGKDSIMKFKTNETKLELNNFEGAFVESTMFAKIEIFDQNKYDEKMGVGSIFGSQEGYDLVYRLLQAGKQMYFSPSILFYHSDKIETRTTEAEIKRAFYYSCGLGYLCKKHKFKDMYRKRMYKLKLGIPIIAIIRHKELKYFRAQKMGLQLGYDYLT